MIQKGSLEKHQVEQLESVKKQEIGTTAVTHLNIAAHHVHAIIKQITQLTPYIKDQVMEVIMIMTTITTMITTTTKWKKAVL